MWLYAVDNEREQSLFCKHMRNAHYDMLNKLCINMHNGYFSATLYNETLRFEHPVTEGWMQLGVLFELDSTTDFTKITIMTHQGSNFHKSYRLFSYRWYDSFEYDLVFGARYNSTG